MGKPLLTDEMIARANRGEKIYEEDGFDPEETIVISTDETKRRTSYSESNKSQLEQDFKEDDNYDDYDEDLIVKSRRIENAKRGKFQSKLNWILAGIILLLALLMYAVFKL